jgi:signal transduction histidine kinase
MSERARLLGGRVRIDTAPGKGTTIAVDIPLKNKEYERLG